MPEKPDLGKASYDLGNWLISLPPLERVKQSDILLEQMRGLSAVIGNTRRDALLDLRDSGWSVSAIADELRVTKQAVSNALSQQRNSNVISPRAMADVARRLGTTPKNAVEAMRKAGIRLSNITITDELIERVRKFLPADE